MPSELATIDQDSGLPLVALSGYRALDAEPEMIKEILKENISSGLTEFDLDRVKVPSGGGTVWEEPTLEGIRNTESITGIIIWYRDSRAYWKVGFDDSGGGSPPDCSSVNSDVGIGDPGGRCSSCPLSQFGTAEHGKGQACKQVRQIFMLRPASIIPMVITAPPTSLKGIRNYMMRLSGRMVPYYGVTTRLMLEKDKNQDGITYGKIIPEAVERLDEDQFKKIQGIRSSMIGALENINITTDDYSAN